MNVNPVKIIYKKVKDIRFIESFLKGKLYQIDYFNYESEQRYGHELVECYTKYGVSMTKQVSTLKREELVVDLK